ncbi:MAG: hypothetical protein JWN84_3423 [Nocardioides sp.]|jgi:hypothetical protein|nr:hypothetical protein [Nocardioides sp.]
MPRAAPSADAPARRTPVTVPLVAAGAAAALGAALLISPEHVEDGPVICPFRRLTGLPCPGCGLTRSWVYLAHGWWHEAVTAHPFGVVALAAAVALVVAVAVALARRSPLPDLDAVVRRPWVRALVAVWLVWAAVRLVVAV